MFDSKIIVEEAPKASQQVNRPFQPSRLIDIPPAIPQPPAQPLKPKRKKGKLALIISSIVLGVILFGGGGVFGAYYLGYLDVPFLNSYFTREEVLLSAIDSVSEVESARYAVNFAVAVEPKAKDTELLYEETQGVSAKEKETAAKLKSNVAQVRTGLNLFYDDYTQYPVDLKQLTTSNNYLFDKTITDGLEYKPSEDHTSYTLSAFIEIDGNKKEYTLDSEGETTVDTFPSTSSDSSAKEFISGMADSLSSDFAIEGAITAFATSEGEPQGEWTLSGSYKSSGTKYELATEARIIKNSFYFQATKIPTFPIPYLNLAGLTNKWIRVTEEDLSTIDEQYGVPLDTEDYGKINFNDIRRVYVSFLKTAVSSKYLTVKRKFPSEKIDGQKYEHYRLMLDENHLKDFLKSFFNEEEKYCASNDCLFNSFNALSGGEERFEFDEKNFDDTFQETYDEMKESQMIRLLHDLTDIDIFLQKNNKAYRIRTTTQFAFHDEEEKMKGKQFRVTTELVIDKVGEKPSVEEPKDFIKPEDLEKLLLGYSDAEWKFKQQYESVSKVRNALNSYASSHEGKYPEKIGDLVDISDDLLRLDDPLSFLKKNNRYAQVTIKEAPTTVEGAPLELETLDISPFYSSTLTEVPNDVFTGKPYVYTSDGKSYTLVYQMELPPEEDLDDEKIPSYQAEQFVQGQNTADKYVFSREKEAKQDTDKDGLTGNQEVANGTNPKAKDTDEDKASDFDEVQAKSDPLDPLSSPTPQKPTMSYKSGSVAGGSSVTISYITRSKTVAIYFGDRRAFVHTSYPMSIDYYGYGNTTSDITKSFTAVIPTYPGDIAQGQTKEVVVKLVDGDHEFVIGNFTYNGGQKKDTDADGLADNEEYSIGTSTTKADSDGDEYSDFVEVNAGYDPKNAPTR